ncbi:hypothetical protein [Streptomyces sp. NPDC001843]|uniref:hypothetical protein n=1 Tax=Streptomyces sp. NPDC001843 TaxID=3364617 RepID=UPI0036A2AD29
MLSDALTAAAAAAGTAVASSAGTELWATVRATTARWLGRNDEVAIQAELERLDASAAAVIAGAPEAGADDQRGVVADAWRERFLDFLCHVRAEERQHIAAQVQAWADDITRRTRGSASAGTAGLAVAGDVHIHAENHGYAAGVQNFGNPLANPTGSGPASPA